MSFMVVLLLCVAPMSFVAVRMLKSSLLPGGGGGWFSRVHRRESPEGKSAIMATVPKQTREIDYSRTDGRPMGETEIHIDDMIDARQFLRDRFAAKPNVYVGGTLLLYSLFDPRAEYLDPPLQGFRLNAGEYVSYYRTGRGISHQSRCAVD